jgi:hypothetical protein
VTASEQQYDHWQFVRPASIFPEKSTSGTTDFAGFLFPMFPK